MEKIKVAVLGANGKMGREVIKAVYEDENLILVGAVGRQLIGQDIGEVIGIGQIGVKIMDDLTQALIDTKPNVVVDFTFPGIVFENSKTILNHGAHAIVGTTGLVEPQLKELNELAKEKQVGIIVAPNFALGAILMMKCTQMAAKFLPNVEIIEYHHDGKLDSPSGTAIKTAQLIQEVRQPSPLDKREFFEKVVNARGADLAGIRMHSVRLPGMVAHQEVIFGDQGQFLTIRHDSINRESFMPGVVMAVKEVIKLTGLIYGLENIMNFDN